MECPHCGSTIEEGAQFCPVCGRRLSSAGQETRTITQIPPPPTSPPRRQIPRTISRRAIAHRIGRATARYRGNRASCRRLLSGIWLMVFLMFYGASGWYFTICAAPLGIYAIVLGVMEIMRATKILPDPVREVNTSRTLPIMQIVNIISGNVLSLVTGILTLVFNDDPEVQAYYRAVQAGVSLEVRS
ncbi:zinc ribbon domain-containing protein [Candidatus Gracilibacteria bacterium]|nr:zinc ribbon domain-containing protein [Candidatus Gracilibacteria bacterium]